MRRGGKSLHCCQEDPQGPDESLQGDEGPPSKKHKTGATSTAPPLPSSFFSSPSPSPSSLAPRPPTTPAPTPGLGPQSSRITKKAGRTLKQPTLLDLIKRAEAQGQGPQPPPPGPPHPPPHPDGGATPSGPGQTQEFGAPGRRKG